MDTRRATSLVLALPLALLPATWSSEVYAQEPETEEESATARFALASSWGRPGEVIAVTFGVETAEAVSMVSWSFEYDPAVFEFLEPVLNPGLAQMLESSAESDGLFDWYGDPEEGWVQIDLVVDFEGRPDGSLPPGLAKQLATLRFRAHPDASPGQHALRFSRPGSAPYEGHFADEDGPVYNAVRFAGAPIDPAGRFRGTPQPDLEDGVISVAPIIGDVGIFVRGDANLDFSIDISDPVAVLDGLFIDGGRFICPASADANADAEIDIGDPITVLNYLFIGTGDWTPTSERVGENDGDLPCDELYEPTDPDESP